MGARLAAENAGPMDLMNLRAVLEDAEGALKRSSIEQLRTFTVEFQIVVLKAARNDVLADLLKTLRERVRNHRLTTMNVPGRDEETVVFCRALLRAIEDRDPDAAERIARANRRRTLELRLKMVRSMSQPA